jgi:hypothetical protein
MHRRARAAAQRFRLSLRGQAVVYRGRSRDTAWFSIIDSEWPALRQAFEQWLDDGNFDAKDSSANLSALTRATLTNEHAVSSAA